ncbi:O-methyltransferase [Mariniflexile sp. AS56]|uniref:O-methyltransferase n=1 Tax=Mariniflexile sp. AS56 TaxID=3063957 RepID=UPI0026EFACE5|nr:class I SAM-dependent methyltransferase [Mariniflexile sp. AS56]MDO7172747.1 class I SAM-dependent methyltransferase [Mariniflexile sp. AS56]
MTHQIKSYLKFLLKSSNEHGVHSPFVYNLVTKCFYDHSTYEAYKNIETYKENLLQIKTKITVTDLGAGSTVIKENQRNISEITKNAGSTNKRAKLLYRLSSYFNFETILELGTSLGIATHAMRLGAPNSKITTIEGCPVISEYTRTNFERLQLENINLKTGDFKDILRKETSNKYDLVFFDGNHQKEATLHYFETLLNTVHNDSVFIFDDIYWSEGMTQAWETIKQHPRVTVTIDTFFWGFVFFRKEQVKEHFTIRI